MQIREVQPMKGGHSDSRFFRLWRGAPSHGAKIRIDVSLGHSWITFNLQLFGLSVPSLLEWFGGMGSGNVVMDDPHFDLTPFSVRILEP